MANGGSSGCGTRVFLSEAETVARSGVAQTGTCCFVHLVISSVPNWFDATENALFESDWRRVFLFCLIDFASLYLLLP